MTYEKIDRLHSDLLTPLYFLQAANEISVLETAKLISKLQIKACQLYQALL